MQLLVPGQFMAAHFLSGEFAVIEKLAGCAAGESARFRFGGFPLQRVAGHKQIEHAADGAIVSDTATMDRQDSV